MEIKDLKPKQGNVELVAEVIDKGDIREFEKFGKQGRVCNARIKDASGEIALTLWNEQIDQVNVGDTIKITNGYVNEWQGEMQVTTGKFGKLEITAPSDVKPEEMKTDRGSHILTKDEKTEEQALDEGVSEEPSIEESETGDEEVEAETLEEEDMEKPTPVEESESKDEKTEENIKIEEEEIK
jgi:replication factor A1